MVKLITPKIGDVLILDVDHDDSNIEYQDAWYYLIVDLNRSKNTVELFNITKSFDGDNFDTWRVPLHNLISDLNRSQKDIVPSTKNHWFLL